MESDPGEDVVSPVAECEPCGELIDSLPVGIVVTTPSGVFVNANPAFVDMFGYSGKEEVRELSAVDLYLYPDDRDRLISMLREGAVRDFECLLKRKDGAAFWGSFSSIISISSEGETLIYTALQDITGRKDAESRLLMLGRAVEQTIDGVVITDLDGTVLYANRTFASMHGYRAHELTGRSMEHLHTREQLEGECAAFNNELWLTRVHQGEVGRKRSDGSTFSTWTTGTLLEDEDGHPIGYVKTVHDITEHKAMENRLTSIQTELESYAKAVSRDLKEPLSEIANAGSRLKHMLESMISEDKVREAVGLVERNARQASMLVDGMLALSRVRQASLEMSDIDVKEVVTELLEEYSAEIAERGLSVEMDDDLGVVFANREMVRELFSNLLSNAIRHNTNSNPVVEIRCLGEDGGGRNRYLVRDNGPGIKPGELHKVFLPFYRGEGGGIGAGLAIVDRILSSCNGDIEVYNDNGACFEVLI